MPQTPGSIAGGAVSDVSSTPQSLPYSSPLSTRQSSRGRGRGRPRKELIPPTYHDKPENPTKEELLHWKKKKNTAKWRYEKLMSEAADTFRTTENARVKRSQEIQRQNIIDAARGESSVYQHIADTAESPRSRKKEKSRKR